ncbi:transcriptional regulator with HTH domain and aminotransferase domain [Desulfoscipio gibsoniae DSM 7213]|uniref:Transcriptional regulator with HTH domain and aminotransferase domain n=2 Tax=Desulfoscipio gibsoniae TaxID=102134 RepID=R4KRX2_9FIRM|nr:transcriptional regulator with HTH domain and aminotransferase domain [Desulfoscipio gibsoniae DSM 7213]
MIQYKLVLFKIQFGANIRVPVGGYMLGIELRRNSGVSLARQIYRTLRNQMTEGRLKQGDVLPSTRELAKHLTVSRNTVYEAYEMLSAEGFIESRPGSQTRVANGLLLAKADPPAEHFEEAVQATISYLVDFQTGQPDLRYFPQSSWLQYLRKAAESLPQEQWGYSGAEGIPALRREIAGWVYRSKGMTVHPQNIFITSGATQALHLLAELLSVYGKDILMEDPCHMGMLRVLQGKGFNILPVPVDKQGLQTDFLKNSGACAIYVTPSHQFPLGGILPATRRAALIRFARENDLFIIEDDYDSEFRYCGPPVAPLYTMDSQRVIYVGTFSKILYPALRIGFVVLPRRFHSQWCYLRRHVDVQNPPFEQAALAKYLRTRKLDRHVRKMRKLYGQRREILLQAIEEKFSRTWHPWGDASGLHLALEFPGLHFDQAFLLRCKESGIRIALVDYHSINKNLHSDKLLLGYGHLEAKEIRQGVSLLHKCLHAASRR